MTEKITPVPEHQLVVPGRTKPYIMAHRGNKVLCPENTIASFRQAIQDGADILETDLHLSQDDVFMCIHDSTLERTTNGVGTVNAKSLSELKQLSASNGRPEFEQETIPTLAELAAILPADVALALELKTDSFLDEKICRQLVEELTTLGIRNRTLVISFSKARTLAVHHLAPDIPAGLITMSGLRPDAEMQIVGPFWPLLCANPFYMKTSRSRGQIVCPLDPTPDSRLNWYQRLRVDAILTDNPQITCKLVKKYE